MKKNGPAPENSLARIRENLRALRLVQIETRLDEELALALKEKTPPTEFLERLLNIEGSSGKRVGDFGPFYHLQVTSSDC